jgi:cell division protein FtsN
MFDNIGAVLFYAFVILILGILFIVIHQAETTEKKYNEDKQEEALRRHNRMRDDRVRMLDINRNDIYPRKKYPVNKRLNEEEKEKE